MVKYDVLPAVVLVCDHRLNKYLNMKSCSHSTSGWIWIYLRWSSHLCSNLCRILMKLDIWLLHQWHNNLDKSLFLDHLLLLIWKSTEPVEWLLQPAWWDLLRGPVWMLVKFAKTFVTGFPVLPHNELVNNYVEFDIKCIVLYFSVNIQV